METLYFQPRQREEAAKGMKLHRRTQTRIEPGEEWDLHVEVLCRTEYATAHDKASCRITSRGYVIRRWKRCSKDVSWTETAQEGQVRFG